MHQNVAKEKTETWTGLDLAKNMTKQVEDQTEGEKKKISFGMSTKDVQSDFHVIHNFRGSLNYLFTYKRYS